MQNYIMVISINFSHASTKAQGQSFQTGILNVVKFNTEIHGPQKCRFLKTTNLFPDMKKVASIQLPKI